MTEPSAWSRGSVQYARLWIAGTTLVGLMLVTLGGGLISKEASHVDDIGHLTLDSPLIIWGTLMSGLGIMSLLVAVIALGVSLGHRLNDA